MRRSEQWLALPLRARLDKRRNAGISEIRAAAERQAYFGCPRCGVWDGDIAPLKPRHLFLHHPSPKVIGKDTADPRHRSISLEAGPSCAVIKCKIGRASCRERVCQYV